MKRSGNVTGKLVAERYREINCEYKLWNPTCTKAKQSHKKKTLRIFKFKKLVN